MKKTALLLLILSTNLYASSNIGTEPYDPKPMVEGNRRVDELIEWHKTHPGELPPLTEQEKYEFFIKEGVPLPGTGATVVDKKEMKFTKSQSAMVNKFNMEQKTKGYVEQQNEHAKNLLAMQETAEKEYNARRNAVFNAQDTHLYEVKNNMKMAYKYNGVPSNLVTKVIGYAPGQSFITGGWTGAVEFFIPQFKAVCAYHEVNIELTKSSAYIPKEIARYIVNNKITTVNAVGSKESGFVYEIEWWDKKFKRNLECAVKEYSTATADASIELAKEIDKGQ